MINLRNFVNYKVIIIFLKMVYYIIDIVWISTDSEGKRDDIFIVSYNDLCNSTFLSMIWKLACLCSMMHIFILQTYYLRDVDFIFLFFWGGRCYKVKL